MTTYPHPDFDIQLTIPKSDFDQICGISYSVTVKTNSHPSVEGMVIIPGKQDNDNLEVCTCWLWAEPLPSLLLGTLLSVQFNKVCDPGYSSKSKHIMRKFTNNTFTATIIKDWNNAF